MASEFIDPKEPDVFRLTRAMDMRLVEAALSLYAQTHSKENFTVKESYRIRNGIAEARKEIEREWAEKARGDCRFEDDEGILQEE